MKETIRHDLGTIVRSEDVQLPTPIPWQIRGFMFSCELEWLYHAAIITKAQGVKGDLLEIGSYEGLSTSALAQAGQLTCVDAWGSVDGPITVDSSKSFDTFVQNVAMMRLTSKVHAICGDSRVELPKLHQAGTRFRLIFVDGGHDFETAASDLHWAWKLLSPGGLVVVDDYSGWPEVQRACASSMGPGVYGACGKMAYKAKGFSK